MKPLTSRDSKRVIKYEEERGGQLGRGTAQVVYSRGPGDGEAVWVAGRREAAAVKVRPSCTLPARIALFRASHQLRIDERPSYVHFIAAALKQFKLDTPLLHVGMHATKPIRGDNFQRTDQYISWKVYEVPIREPIYGTAITWRMQTYGCTRADCPLPYNRRTGRLVIGSFSTGGRATVSALSAYSNREGYLAQFSGEARSPCGQLPAVR